MTTEDLAHQQRFLMEAEQSIRVANREVISAHIPPLTIENILPLAVSVARLRARYLEAAFKFSEKERGDALDESEVAALRRHREMYDEARNAFEALRTAIERGYADLG